MEGLLKFFSDLILFTTGLIVVFLWIGLLVVAAIEAYDSIKGDNVEEDEEY